MSCFMVINDSCSTNMCARQLSFNFSSMVWGEAWPRGPPFGSVPDPGCLFVQQPPKRERDREAHLNYYTSAYNRGRQLSHGKTKLNQI